MEKVRRGLSMGRVQSVAVRLICDREKEREAFQGRRILVYRGAVERSQSPSLRSEITPINGQDADIGTQEHAEHILQAVQGKGFVVHSIERKEKKRNPVAPFITSRLQQEAARKPYFTPKKTMTLAQQLYGRGWKSAQKVRPDLITYMRTDSQESRRRRPRRPGR